MGFRRQITGTAVELPAFMSSRHGAWNRNYEYVLVRRSSLKENERGGTSKREPSLTKDPLRRDISRKKKRNMRASFPFSQLFMIPENNWKIYNRELFLFTMVQLSFNGDLRLTASGEKRKRARGSVQYPKSHHFQFVHWSRASYPVAYDPALSISGYCERCPRSSRIHCSINHQFRADSSRSISTRRVIR